MFLLFKISVKVNPVKISLNCKLTMQTFLFFRNVFFLMDYSVEILFNLKKYSKIDDKTAIGLWKSNKHSYRRHNNRKLIIIRVGVRRSNFMRSKFNFFRRSNFRSWGQNSICSWGRICPIILIRRSTLWSWDQNPNKHYYKFQSHDRSCD